MRRIKDFLNSFDSAYVRFPFTPNDQNSTTAPERSPSATISSSNPRTTTIKQSVIQSSLIEVKAPTQETAKQIVNFMREAWKLPIPQLVISVTGGARFFKITTFEIRNAFQNGLISAALTTGAWIFTDGTNSGVMKAVGDAIDKSRYNTKRPSKIPCIGIASWYYTTDYEHLMHDLEQDGQQIDVAISVSVTSISAEAVLAILDVIRHVSISYYPCRFLSLSMPDEQQPRIIKTEKKAKQSKNQQRIKLYRSSQPVSRKGPLEPECVEHPPSLQATTVRPTSPPSSPSPKNIQENIIEESCSIDLNHTHYLLLDDGNGSGSEWRAKFPKNVANCRADLILKLRAEIEGEASLTISQGQRHKVPVIQILAEGGASSVKTVCEALKTGTYLIVIEGTGRAADLIAEEYRFLYKDKSELTLTIVKN
ncbi:unnamed protein product, partial [Didymodactylos carnosus]